MKKVYFSSLKFKKVHSLF